MDRPLHLRPRVSRIAWMYCLSLLLLMWLAIALAALPVLLQIMMAVLVLLQTVLALRQCARPAVWQLEHQRNGWVLHSDRGCESVTLLPKVFTVLGVISLPFVLENGQHIRVLLWPDSAGREDLRRLRRLLQAS